MNEIQIFINRMKKIAAKKQMAWFALNYGLKFSDL